MFFTTLTIIDTLKMRLPNLFFPYFLVTSSKIQMSQVDGVKVSTSRTLGLLNLLNDPALQTGFLPLFPVFFF